MGAYLSEPNIKKESLDDESGQLSYGASSMQGWRLEQEVGALSKLSFTSIFLFIFIYRMHIMPFSILIRLQILHFLLCMMGMEVSLLGFFFHKTYSKYKYIVAFGNRLVELN